MSQIAPIADLWKSTFAGQTRRKTARCLRTGRLRHPPDEETEKSGGIWLIEGLDLGCINVFAPLEQARDPRPGIGGRLACPLDLAGWRHLHPARTPVRIGVASMASDPVSDDLLLDLGGVARAALRERL